MLKLLVVVVLAALVFGRRGRLGDLVRALGEAPARFQRGLHTDAVDEAKRVADASRKHEA